MYVETKVEGTIDGSNITGSYNYFTKSGTKGSCDYIAMYYNGVYRPYPNGQYFGCVLCNNVVYPPINT